MLEYLTILLPGPTIVRFTYYNRIAIRMPEANQQKSKEILEKLINLTKNCKGYCFLCFDPNHVDAGEIGLELAPGCNWNEILELVK